jgi:hypothetical protein
MPFLTNYSKRGTHVITPMGISSHADFKHTWNGTSLELLRPITSNKNMQKSNKNPEVMIKVGN